MYLLDVLALINHFIWHVFVWKLSFMCNNINVFMFLFALYSFFPCWILLARFLMRQMLSFLNYFSLGIGLVPPNIFVSFFLGFNMCLVLANSGHLKNGPCNP